MRNSDSINDRISRRALPIKGLAMLSIVLYHYFRSLMGRPNDVQWLFTPDVYKELYTLIALTPSNLAVYFFQIFGYLGVPVFFILSGWGLAYAQQKSPRDLAYPAFVRQRLIRVLPMYYLSLCCFGVIYLLAYRHEPALISALLQDLAIKALLLHNFFPAYTFSFNSVYWFIPTLVVLYLFFPLLYRQARQRPILTLCSAILISFILSSWMAHSSVQTRFPAWSMGAFPIVRLGEFALGICIAILGDRQLSAVKTFMAAIIFIMLGFSSFRFEFIYPLHNILIGAGLVFLCLSLPGSAVGRFPLRLLGSLSFPVFLFHRPFISTWTKITATHDHVAISLCIYIVLIVILCWLIQRGYDYILTSGIRNKNNSTT